MKKSDGLQINHPVHGDRRGHPAYLTTHLPSYPPTRLPAYLPTRLPVYLHTRLPVYRSTFGMVLSFPSRWAL